jgi:hypothetical protein
MGLPARGVARHTNARHEEISQTPPDKAESGISPFVGFVECNEGSIWPAKPAIT